MGYRQGHTHCYVRSDAPLNVIRWRCNAEGALLCFQIVKLSQQLRDAPIEDGIRGIRAHAMDGEPAGDGEPEGRALGCVLRAERKGGDAARGKRTYIYTHAQTYVYLLLTYTQGKTKPDSLQTPSSPRARATPRTAPCRPVRRRQPPARPQRPGPHCARCSLARLR